jgi:IS4 transposase
VLDRGYTGFASLKRIDNAGAFFVIRAKRDLRFNRIYSHTASKTGNVTVDQTITLVVARSREEYPDQLRRIKVYDAVNNQSLVFLTNNFLLDAPTVAELYRLRWKIELFFKWIKQHLRIKAFYGTTPNAVNTQIWIALSIYVLVAIVKKELGLEQPLSTILQILSVTLFEKEPISQVLTEYQLTIDGCPDPNQLMLFNL